MILSSILLIQILHTALPDFCPEPQKFGPGPTKNCIKASDPLKKPKSKIEEWLTKDTFEDLFPKSNLGWGGNSCWPYSYESFVIAARYFPRFGTEYVTNDPKGNKLRTSFTAEETYKRDVSAFFSHAMQETGENNGALYSKNSGLTTEQADECFYRGGLYNWFESSPACNFFKGTDCFTPDKGTSCLPAGQYHDDSPATIWFYPSYPDQCYLGRGAIQISYNFNYGPFSAYLNKLGITHNGKDIDLLKNPNLVLTKMDPPLAFMASIWFYMTPQPPKPAMHDIIVGNWVPRQKDIDNGYGGSNLGPTSLVINNECGGESPTTPGGGGENRRIKAFRFFAKYFNFPIGDSNTLSCKNFSGFPKNIGLTYDQDWKHNWDTTKPCDCVPQSYAGLIPYFDPNFYPEYWTSQNKDYHKLCVDQLALGWQGKSCMDRPKNNNIHGTRKL